MPKRINIDWNGEWNGEWNTAGPEEDFVQLGSTFNQPLGALEDAVLVRVVAGALAGNLQHGGNGRRVGVNLRADQLGDVLLDEDDVDVAALEEGLEGAFDLLGGRLRVHHQEVEGGLLRAALADAAQQEAHAAVLVADQADQLAAGGLHSSRFGFGFDDVDFWSGLVSSSSRTFSISSSVVYCLCE